MTKCFERARTGLLAVRPFDELLGQNWNFKGETISIFGFQVIESITGCCRPTAGGPAAPAPPPPPPPPPPPTPPPTPAPPCFHTGSTPTSKNGISAIGTPVKFVTATGVGDSTMTSTTACQTACQVKKALHLFVFSGHVILATFGLQGEALCGMFFFQEITGGPAGGDDEKIFECTLYPVTAWDIPQSQWFESTASWDHRTVGPKTGCRTE